jgi:phytoene dehydrogenase-like protein
MTIETVNTLVIGGGVSGLFATAKLAVSRIRVVLCEQNDFAGGLHGRVQVGSHLVPLTAYKALGLHEGSRLSFFFDTQKITRMQFSDHAFFSGGDEARLPADAQNMQETLENRFPKQKTGIAAVMRAIALLYEAAGPARKTGLSSEHIKALRDTAGRTYESFIREYIDDPALITLFSLRIFSSANDMITMAVYLGNILWGGLYWVPDGSARLTDQLLQHIRNAEAAELRLSTPVSRLFLSQDRGWDALLDGKEELHAEHVVCACDPARLVKMLPPGEMREQLVSCLEDSRPSLSATVVIFVMSPAFTARLASHKGTARLHVCNQKDLFDVYRRREAGGLDVDLVKVTWDCDQASSHPRIYLEIDCQYWQGRGDGGFVRQAVATGNPKPFLEVLERIFPKAAEQVEAFRIISPAEIEATTGNTYGACSGWNNAARPSRLDSLLAKKGIYLVGQWSHYGTGLPMLEQAAEAICVNITRQNQKRNAFGRGLTHPVVSPVSNTF